MPTAEELAATGVPIGTVVAFAGEVNDTGGVVEVKQGWLLCNGAAADDRRFPQLFQAIQASHGNGSDSPGPLPGASFNLPDYRGLFLRGVAGARNDRDPNTSDADRPQNHAGGNVGNRVGSIQGDQLARHRHAVAGHRLEARGGAGFEGAGMASNSNQSAPWTRDYDTSDSGGGETRPKNAYVHWIIRAK